jgi:glycosyltransferase involved in cell wall biosynthesis
MTDNPVTSSEFLITLKQIDERLQSIELKLAEMEKSRRSFGDFFRKISSPKIFNFYHYVPRKLEIPASYFRDQSRTSHLTFAIVTPTFNQSRFLAETIKSVLDQQYPALSYIVQDGGSKDGAVNVLKSFGDRLNWESGPDSGQTNAINRGFASVKGEIMAYVNGDDLLLPGSLAYVAAAFEKYPDVDVVYGHRIVVNAEGDEIARWVLPPHDAVAIKWADYIPQETMFWRKRVWDALGGLDESFHYAMDWDFILRAHGAGFKFARLPRFLGCFRVHPQQKTTAESDVGLVESNRLRLEHLGFSPSQSDVHRAIRGFMRRHVLFHRMYKMPLVRY